MKRLRKKLHSQSGASILLALLMFLLCCMVAASILAAAASNAGKVRSSRVEQQKQLTLSSAIELVAGQLAKAEYTGHYKLYEWREVTGYDTYTDADGKEHKVPIYEDYFYYRQTEGEFTCGELTGLLPLGKELDWMFGGQFSRPGCGPLYTTEPSGGPHLLKIQLPSDLEGYPYPKNPDSPTVYEVPDVVTVEVTLSHTTRHISLTAWLGSGSTPSDGDPEVMHAELVAVGVPVLDYAPGGRSPGLAAPSGDDGMPKTTDPAGWELNWIKKGAD